MSVIRLERGDNDAYAIAVTRNGVPVNLTGCVLRFTAKKNLSDSDDQTVITKSSANAGEIIINAGTGGTATIYFVPADTSALAPLPMELFYDVQLTDTALDITTVERGWVFIISDVTVTAP